MTHTVNIIMPKLGLTMQEGTITSWLKREGELVTNGEVLAVIETDKVTHDLEAKQDGQLHILVPEGATVETGATIGYLIAASSDSAPDQTLPDAAQQPVPDTHPARERSAIAAPPEKRSRKREISPLAWRMAQEHRLDLAQLTGSGPRGRIHKADILKALQQQAIEAKHAQTPDRLPARSDTPQPAPTTASGREAGGVPYDAQPLSSMRRRIAEHMQTSLRDTAQLTLMVEANVTGLRALQMQLQEESQHAHRPRITLTPIIVKVVALALRQHKLLNATLAHNELHLYREINIGVATALEEGLLVPVIRHADQKSIAEIASELILLTEKARNGSITPDELSAGTFTITNLGAFEIDYFTPILTRQQSGILGIGRMIERLSSTNAAEKQIFLGLSLTFDHRIVDGAPAAQFLKQVRYTLEHPLSMLLTAR